MVFFCFWKGIYPYILKETAEIPTKINPFLEISGGGGSTILEWSLKEKKKKEIFNDETAGGKRWTLVNDVNVIGLEWFGWTSKDL